MFWRVTRDTVAVAVKVQPRARNPGLYGAVPDTDGERLATARRKTLRVSGDPAAITARLAAL